MCFIPWRKSPLVEFLFTWRPFFAVLGLALALTVFATHASPTDGACNRYLAPPPVVKNPRFSRPPRIVTTSFAGSGRFDQTLSVQRLKNTEGAFTSGKVQHESRVGFGPDELVIGEAQDFSFATMVATNYLTPQQAKKFKVIGKSLEQGQVFISEVIRDASALEIKQNYGLDVEARQGGLHTIFDFDSNLIPAKTAALFSFAGQVWDRQTGQKRNLSLPWELEEARKGQQLDRNKYPFVFEWGRAAQEVASEINPLYALNALQNYQQVIALNGRLDEAFVMVHSFDPVNSRLYARMTNNGYYPPDKPRNPNDQLFLAPLEWALKTHPPSRVSQRIADLVKLSGGALSELEAVNLLVENRLARWSELDYQKHGRTQEFPIVVNDLSLARPHLMIKILETIPTNHENRQAMLDKLATLDGELTLFSTSVEGKYENAGDSVVSSYTYHQRNAVEVTNLDAKMALRDPNYAKSVLYGAYMFEVQRLADILKRYHKIPWEQGLIAASDLIHDLKIEFGITTHVPLIQHQLEKLKPTAKKLLPKVQILDGGKPSADDLKRHPRWHREAQMYFFTADQILLMGHQDRSFVVGNRYALTPGKWRAEYLQSQLDLF